MVLFLGMEMIWCIMIKFWLVWVNVWIEDVVRMYLISRW